MSDHLTASRPSGRTLPAASASVNALPRIAIYFRMFGPYILARLDAAAQVAKVVGIEGSRRSTTYAWEPLAGTQRFERVTLFEDRAVEAVPNRELVTAVRTALDRADPDIVVVGGWSHVEALAMIAWARHRKRPVVMMSESTAQDTSRHWLKELTKSRIVKLADAALVGGQPQTDYIAQLGLARSKIFVGYDTVDNDFFARGAAAARANPHQRRELGLPERYFMASARFIPKKNLHRLLRAYAAYREDRGEDAWDLVIVGDGPLRAELEALGVALGVTARVHFAGFRQYHELPAYYAFAEGFLHLSTSEQWGLVVNEAMAAGLPVIVSRQCGCSHDLVIDGENGWTVDARFTEEIVRRMGDLMTADRGAMAARGRQIIAQFGPDRFAAGLQLAVRAARAEPSRWANPADRLLLAALSFRNSNVQ